MGGRTKRSWTAKTRKQGESNDVSNNTDSMLGMEVVTSKPCVAGDSGEDVRSTWSKRKQLETNPFNNLSRMIASSDDSSFSSGVPAILGDDLGDNDAPPPTSPPPSPPPPLPPMTIDSNSLPPLGTEYYYPALDALHNMPIFLSRKKLSYCFWRFLMDALTMCMIRLCPT
jgi:hypothetical protein